MRPQGVLDTLTLLEALKEHWETLIWERHWKPTIWKNTMFNHDTGQVLYEWNFESLFETWWRFLLFRTPPKYPLIPWKNEFMPFKSKLVKVLTFFFPILLYNRMSDTIDYFLLVFWYQKRKFQFLTSKKQFKKFSIENDS